LFKKSKLERARPLVVCRWRPLARDERSREIAQKATSMEKDRAAPQKKARHGPGFYGCAFACGVYFASLAI
jgi:hypothetical protein